MMLIPYNSIDRADYAVGIGWVLPVTRDCEVCGDKAEERTKPHPVMCEDRPDPRSFYTMDTAANEGAGRP